jgi:ubiquitin-like modifier-activating enzyme ATG7
MELEELIKEHDVVFLLLDSREARWLPTVQSIAHNKLVITIAVGFDTFLVMRHGLSPEDQLKTGNDNRLGCYFCNDVVAPKNSLGDRTLDQQCTVSRPALCTMSSSLGVELVTSLLNHPLGNAAKANEDFLQCDRSNLGILPQQMRGDLNTFEIRCMYGEAFDSCTGCSDTIQQAYKSDR